MIWAEQRAKAEASVRKQDELLSKLGTFFTQQAPMMQALFGMDKTLLELKNNMLASRVGPSSRLRAQAQKFPQAGWT